MFPLIKHKCISVINCLCLQVFIHCYVPCALKDPEDKGNDLVVEGVDDDVEEDDEDDDDENEEQENRKNDDEEEDEDEDELEDDDADEESSSSLSLLSHASSLIASTVAPFPLDCFFPFAYSSSFSNSLKKVASLIFNDKSSYVL